MRKKNFIFIMKVVLKHKSNDLLTNILKSPIKGKLH